MSSIEDTRRNGYIKVHHYQSGAPMLLNLAFVVDFKKDERPNPKDKSDLKLYEMSHLQMFGQSALLVKETVEEIAELIGAAGIDIHQSEEGGGDD